LLRENWLLVTIKNYVRFIHINRQFDYFKIHFQTSIKIYFLNWNKNLNFSRLYEFKIRVQVVLRQTMQPKKKICRKCQSWPLFPDVTSSRLFNIVLFLQCLYVIGHCCVVWWFLYTFSIVETFQLNASKRFRLIFKWNLEYLYKY